MQYYLAVWSLLLGLVIGSFLNVVIYRLPRRESLVRPGSHCPGCGAAIGWRDNVPVVSWLILRGRCRSCKSRIALRYPLVEGLTGVAYVAAYLRVGPAPALFVAWALIAVVIALAFIHHDLAIIPDRLVVPSIVVGLAASIALDVRHWWYYIAACLGAGVLILLLSFLTRGVTGFSQAKMAGLLGAVLGPWVLAAVPVALLILGFVTGIALVFRQKGRLRARTVFAPCQSKRDARRHMEALRTHDAKIDAEVMTWL